MLQVKLLRDQLRDAEHTADDAATTRLQFSESMNKTKNAADRCDVCRIFCCCVRGSSSSPAAAGNHEDRYAQEILATEIETLKRAIKEVTEIQQCIRLMPCQSALNFSWHLKHFPFSISVSVSVLVKLVVILQFQFQKESPY